MKSLFVLCLLSLVTYALGGTSTHSRGCIYVLGHCQSECPEGTHGYGTGCGRKLPEPTCDQPEPVLEEGNLCDFTACYCDPPTVRESKSNKCIPLDECPKKE